MFYNLEIDDIFSDKSDFGGSKSQLWRWPDKTKE
jgi:hypothetical protein